MQKRVFMLFLAIVLILTCSVGVCFAGNETAGSGSVAQNTGSGTESKDSGTEGRESRAEDTGRGAASMVPAPEIGAPSALLMEAETGQILYEKNINAPLHISAANKLMTILVAIENGNLSSYVTASSESVNTEGSTLSLVVGEKYLLGDLLSAVMLTSANDAAIAVAEHVSSGDIGKFVDLMNKTAEKLGMNDTHFSNPTGLYDESQYTTARDIALLVRYAIANPQFNTQTVISTASRSNLKLISIVLDAPEETMFTDTKALLDYGFDNFRKSTLVSKNDVIKTIEFEGHEIRLISQSDIMYVHPLGESYIKDFNVNVDLKTPLKKTVPAGNAVYVLNDDTEVRISLYPESEIVPVEDTKTRLQKLVMENKDIFLIVAVLVAIEILLLIANVGKLIARLITFVQHRDRKGSE